MFFSGSCWQLTRQRTSSRHFVWTLCSMLHRSSSRRWLMVRPQVRVGSYQYGEGAVMYQNTQPGAQSNAMLVIELMRAQLSQVQYDLAIAQARLAQHQTREIHVHAEPVTSDDRS